MKVAVGAAEGREGAGVFTRLAARAAVLRASFAVSIEEEFAWRRPSLWLPVAAGAGAIVCLTAPKNPSLPAGLVALLLSCALAFALRARRGLFAFAAMACAFSVGFVATQWRIARVAAPVLQRTQVTQLTGFVEQVDPRRQGARFVLRLTSAQGMADDAMPYRVRLTTRGAADIAAGAHVALKARLMAPARAALPGGYDFAREAYFARIGAVGTALGRIETTEPPEPPSLWFSTFAALDRFRNRLVARVAESLPGDTGAIAAAMVAGKRDLLSGSARELIKQAGIFHIITISGIQMTLVAGIFFVGLRRGLALSQTLALNYPIKKWAAGAAICGAVLYDLATGSRVGTERALAMTTILLAAVIFDRPSLSMRNLALAAMLVVVFEPEALLGASFQLSFAAVAALIAVWEARGRAVAAPAGLEGAPGRARAVLTQLSAARWRGIGGALFATFCATAATASFMAANFHELSPYVLIGNPLTLAMIEFFAIPSALLGALLYPFGLDGPVWAWLGLGIDLVLWIARKIAAAPGAAVHVFDFAPWALPFLTLAVLSAVIWRTRFLRLSAAPLALIGFFGATQGPAWDVAIQPTGESAVVRDGEGRLNALGRVSLFATEQWLRADADGRDPRAANGALCDSAGCVALLPDGRAVAVAREGEALLADCGRAAVVVAPFRVPGGCAAALVFDRERLRETGAVTLRFAGDKPILRMARAQGEDRPWSPAPRIPRFRAKAAQTRAHPIGDLDDAATLNAPLE
ncbi:MAG: ComEC/Rec2 family competence protein [Hyphomicrobiales bacterium]|nr:ComEC/Rec2 family competence protein [Hyphomicrobiales bacterium]